MDEEKNPHREHFEGAYLWSVVLWGIFHAGSSVYNAVSSIDKGYGHSYDWMGCILTAAYLLAVLAANALMMVLKERYAAKIAGRYWLAAGVICLLGIIGLFQNLEVGGVLILCTVSYTHLTLPTKLEV